MTKHKINWLELILQLFVVFVGVTLGFFVNDWATQRNNTKLETLHLTTLAKEINYNYYVFERKFHEDSLWLNKAEKIINLIEEEQISIQDSIESIKALISSSEKSLIQQNALQTLLNTGDINLIKNTKLKYDLNYYSSNSTGKVVILENSLFDFSVSKTRALAMDYYLIEKDEVFAKRAFGILAITKDYKKALVPLYKAAKADSNYLLEVINDSSPYVNLNFKDEL